MQASEEIEAIRRAYDSFEAAFSGRDVEAFLEQIDEDVEWVPIMAALEGRVYHGHDGVRRWFEDLRRDWEVFDSKPEEIRDLGDGHFLVLGHWLARGRGSGVELSSQPASWLMKFREGKVVRLQTFTTREEALKATERMGSKSRGG
jgi:ketosteroid isomerase-like protein